MQEDPLLTIIIRSLIHLALSNVSNAVEIFLEINLSDETKSKAILWDFPAFSTELTDFIISLSHIWFS